MRRLKTVKGAALLLALAAALGLTVFASAEESKKGQDPLNVKSGTIASNVYFEDTSLSGLKLEEAIAEIEAPFEDLKKTVFILLNPDDSEHMYEASATQVGISWDLTNIQEKLLKGELSGTLIERYKKAKDIQADPIVVSANLSVDTDTAEEFFAPLKEQWHKEPVNAKVSMKTGKLVVTPSTDGLNYDFTPGIQKMAEDVLAGNTGTTGRYIIEATPEYIEPGLTTERAKTFTIIGAYSTGYQEPTTEILANRENNLIVSTSNMDGSTFAPGELISALAMYGDVSIEGGYKMAGTYNNGEHVDEIGGGICQTTTTLYNAGLYAELEINYRRQHSMYVAYVTPSRDAMVYAAGHSDFRMINNTSDYITIESWVDTKDQTLHVIIVGHEDHPADHSVEFESEILEVTTPDVQLITDPDLPVGTDEKIKRDSKYVMGENGYPGVKSRLWKVTTDGDTVTRTILNPGDSYKPGDAIVYVAADTYVTLEAEWNPDEGEVQHHFSFYFLNGYPLSTDLNTLSSSERYNFNKTMAAAMKAKGLSWPGYTEPTTKAPTSKSKTTKEEETTKATKKEETTTTTEEPTTTEAPTPEETTTEEPATTEAPTPEETTTEAPAETPEEDGGEDSGE